MEEGRKETGTVSGAADYGRASISPREFRAGARCGWTITYETGKEGIREGGGIRILPPRRGTVLWEPGKVTAFSSNREAYLEVLPEKVYPLTFHHSNYPAVDVRVYGTALREGDRIEVRFGAVGGYNSGRFIQGRAQTHSGREDFEVYADSVGNGLFSREKIRPGAFRAVPGDLRVRVEPAGADHLRLSLRCSPAGDTGGVCVLSVEDGYDNPVEEEYEIKLAAEKGAVEARASVVKPAGARGVAFPVKLSGKGIQRLGGRCPDEGLYGVSNPVDPGFFGRGMQVYFGDLHVMTASTGIKAMSGTTGGAVRYARDVRGLDFTAVTNTGGGTKPGSWPEEREIFRKYNEDYRFVTIPAWEMGLKTGHKNIFYPQDSAPLFQPKQKGLDCRGKLAELWEFLSGLPDAMAISHHPNTHSETDPCEGWGPLEIDTINPRFERLVEICQNRGSFEKDRKGKEIYFGGFGSSVNDILRKGYRLGFVGGTDNHLGRPGSQRSCQSGLDAESSVTGGITGVIASGLTRGALWNALKARRCYASTSVKMLLDFRLNGKMMGEEELVDGGNRASFARRKISVKACGVLPLERLVIVRNGEDVYEEELKGSECNSAWEDTEPLSRVRDDGVGGVYYYARVYQKDGNLAWSSPVWLIMP